MQVPDYYTIIKRPMDCQTILSKAKTVKYTNVKEMLADVRQMFKNCAIYNEDSSEIFKMGKWRNYYNTVLSCCFDIHVHVFLKGI